MVIDYSHPSPTVVYQEVNLIIAPWFLLTPVGPAMARGITAGMAKVQALLPGR
ncbi:hypothetical protein ACM26W_03535 [Halomonas sp. HK25]|uniref:hypothetical protein n=1 Tax=Halomonas sp. HK25 TaxID=3394321 RepID=UPI0039FD1186